MDNGSIIGLVGLITAVFTGIGLILARIKHSECLRGCCEIDTRSESAVIQAPSAPPPTPHTHHKHKDNSEFDLQIAEIEV